MSALQRSDKAKYAMQVFYRSVNDVDIFIEDTAIETKKIYVNLLRRVLGGEISFSQVFPIGDKARVYQRCQADQGVRARPAVYIVDGDHDDLLGNRLPVLKRLFRLNRYCVENYLFDEDAAVSYLDDEIAARSREDIRASLDFAAWSDTISADLVRHVKAVVVAHRRACGSGLPRANVSLAALCSSDDGFTDCGLVDALVEDCKHRVDLKHGDGSFDAECQAIAALFLCDHRVAVLRFVSGKTVLLPLLRRRIRTLFGVSANEALFRVRLSKVCDVSELQGVRAAIC